MFCVKLLGSYNFQALVLVATAVNMAQYVNVVTRLEVVASCADGSSRPCAAV